MKNTRKIFLNHAHSRLEKISSAIRDTSVSRHNGGLIDGTSWTPQYHSVVMVRGISRGPSIGPQDCRETPVTRTAVRLITVDFPVWWHKTSSIHRTFYDKQNGIPTMIRCTTVREASALGQIKAPHPSETPGTSLHYVIKGFKGAFN